ncbi:MAG: hypothetical protein QOJ78_671, partial [Pseudonocardiales bacterium]|nr:hypothetical protein [Pseudonocardiales bacterium]
MIRSTRKSTVRLLAALSGAVTLCALAIVVPNQAEAVVTCTAPAGATALSGSNFEIDADGNLKVDGSTPCIDWLTAG